ncbi:MAG: aminotransferase class I/II-fold pyridoxal phosphate-dependent enzyme [Candidatus Aenigmarchaeota archaeon]|nr:aminotransferase class I/II-fold pyridoxal phosphate-dependent enzyme [Candidatus Aenigmarchaeota archaeon]
MLIPSQRSRDIEYAIRDVVIPAKEIEKKGKKVYYFNIGDPNKFDFDTPDFLKKEMIKIMKEGKSGYYGDSQGDEELREAIAKRENKKNKLDLRIDDIVVTQGISEGINFLLGTLIEPEKGDEILIGGPSYPIYIQLSRFFGGVPVTYRLDEENKWGSDIEDLESKITERTKAIVVINPNNPTGAVFSENSLKRIVRIAEEREIVLITDEIYDQLIFSSKDSPGLASLTKNVSVIGLNGFSKSYLVPGWRMGYMYFHDPRGILVDFKQSILKEARLRLSPSTPIMKACKVAYSGPQNHIKETNKKLKRRADFAYKRLNEIDGITTQKPEGAFYIFPKVDLGDRWKNDKEFCLDLIKNTGVVFPYGSGFDEKYGKDHFRSVILPPIEMMEEAFGKVDDFMEKS